MTDVIVIGAGHNALVCAAYLAKAGRKVVCLEAAETPGGMAASREFAAGYRVPGFAHAAYPVSAVIRRDLGLDAAEYTPGPPLDTVSLAADEQHLVIGRDGISAPGLADSDAKAYPNFVDRYQGFAAALAPVFATRPPRLKNADFFDKKTLAKLGWRLRIGLGRDSMYEFLRVVAMNAYDLLNEAFDDERLKGAIALDAVLGSAMAPRTPGTVLTWLQRLSGAANGPLSGPGFAESSLVAALSRSAQDRGVKIRCGARVKRVLVDVDRATGVELEGGETLRANIVVSGADPRTTFESLVGSRHLDAMFANRVSQIRSAGVVARLHLALDGLPTLAGVEAKRLGDRLVIAPSMRYIERAFNHAKYGEYSSEPVLEITLPSLHDDSLAPAGHHVMSVNVAWVPHMLREGWAAGKPALTEMLLGMLERYAPGLGSQIVAHEFLTPADIEAHYSATGGHWHHGELTLHQSLMLRPVYGAAQYDTPIEGLYLCSAGCHPGGGLTGLPGKNAAERVLERGTT